MGVEISEKFDCKISHDPQAFEADCIYSFKHEGDANSKTPGISGVDYKSSSSFQPGQYKYDPKEYKPGQYSSYKPDTSYGSNEGNKESLLRGYDRDK